MYDPNRSKNTTINNIEAAQQSAPSQFEKTRRIVLKSMACGSAVAAVPALPAIASISSEPTPTATEQSLDTLLDDHLPLQARGIAVEFSDPESNHIDGAMARVSISNNTESDVELRHLSPGAITTKDGVYNLNARLQKSPVQIRPNGVYHIWIRPDNTAESIAPATVSAGTQAMIPVTIVRGNKTARPVQHTRLAHAMFA